MTLNGGTKQSGWAAREDELRPLDAQRLLRDERCTATPTQRHALLMIILRTDNTTWDACASMGTIAKDMGVDRTTFVRLVPSLVRGHEGIPITLRRKTGRKRHGHRRDANTYTIGIREGWAREAYENRGTTSLGAPRTQPIGCNTHLGIGALRTGDRGVMHQVLLSDLPSDLPERESPAVSESKPEVRTSRSPGLSKVPCALALRMFTEVWADKCKNKGPFLVDQTPGPYGELAVLTRLEAYAREIAGERAGEFLRHWAKQFFRDTAKQVVDRNYSPSALTVERVRGYGNPHSKIAAVSPKAEPATPASLERRGTFRPLMPVSAFVPPPAMTDNERDEKKRRDLERLAEADRAAEKGQEALNRPRPPRSLSAQAQVQHGSEAANGAANGGTK